VPDRHEVGDKGKANVRSLEAGRKIALHKGAPSVQRRGRRPNVKILLKSGEKSC